MASRTSKGFTEKPVIDESLRGTCPVCQNKFPMDEYGIIEKHEPWTDKRHPRYGGRSTSRLWMCSEKDLLAMEFMRVVVGISRLDHPNSASAPPPMTLREKFELALARKIKNDGCHDVVRVVGFWQETIAGQHTTLVLTHIDYRDEAGKSAIFTYPRGLDLVIAEMYLEDQ